jgi:hypothetical protein
MRPMQKDRRECNRRTGLKRWITPSTFALRATADKSAQFDLCAVALIVDTKGQDLVSGPDRADYHPRCLSSKPYPMLVGTCETPVPGFVRV